MGMSIDEIIAQLKKLKSFHNGSYGASINFALDTMRKYQMFQTKYVERLKADMVAILTEIQLDIEEIEKFTNTIGWELRAKTPEEIKKECSEIIQQKINALKSESEDKE